VRESTKYEHVVAFANALPGIREKVKEHMALRGLPREKVLATVGSSSGDDADPRPKRRICKAEQQLRADHPRQKRSAFSLYRQE
jgi:DNA topoisomerase IB